MRNLKSTIPLYSKLSWAFTGAMVVAGGLFYAAIYRPLSRQTGAVNAQISKVSSELAICQDQTRMLNSVATDVERLRARLREFKTLPQQQDLAQFIKDIPQLNLQANLRKFEHRQGGLVRAGKLNAVPVTLTFEGDFVNVFSFLRHAEELPRLIRVPAMRLEAAPGAMKDKSGQVKVQMTMNVYFAAE
jgi:Tfp pilus assembly protein PilO